MTPIHGMTCSATL